MVLARKGKATLRKRSSTNRRKHERNPDYGTSDSNERECNNRAKLEVETRKRKKSGDGREKAMKIFEDSENDIVIIIRELPKASMHTDSSSSSTSRECSHGTFIDDEEEKIEGIAASKEPVMPRTLKKVVRRGEGGSSSSSDDHSLEADMNKHTLVTKKRKLAMKKSKMRFKASDHASSHSPRVMGEEQPSRRRSERQKPLKVLL
ncbi:hypothetical protein FGB62_205g04 [Gracilaria domingensis]|nr:hypothetical protein FGB62_205g04 [Gracilaria domingensis]